MMAKDPAKRYQTPLEVAKAVRAFISQPAVKPAAPSAPRPATSETSRPEQTAPEQAAPRQAEPADDWASMTASGPRPEPAAKAKAPAHRGPAWLWPAVAGCVMLLGLAVAFAAGVFKVHTPNGTLVVERVPADADVLVDDQKAVSITPQR